MLSGSVYVDVFSVSTSLPLIQRENPSNSEKNWTSTSPFQFKLQDQFLNISNHKPHTDTVQGRGTNEFPGMEKKMKRFKPQDNTEGTDETASIEE